MDRLLALVIFLLIPHLSYAGSSIVVYPDWAGINYAKVGATSTYTASSPAKFTGQLITTSPNSPFFKGLDPRIAKAFSAVASPDLSLARKVGVTAMRALPGGILTAFALYEGYQLANGIWMKNNPQTWPDGQVITNGYGTFPSAGAFCSWFYPNAVPKMDTATAGHCVSSNGGLIGGNDTFVVQNPQQPAGTPATEQDFTDLANNGRDLTIEEARELFDTGYSVPVSMPISKVNDFTNLSAQELQDLMDMGYFQPTPNSIAFPQGDPYTDPVTGEKRQPYVQLDPAPNAGVRVTPYEQVLNPDGTPKLDSNSNPINVPSESEDPCAIDATRAGCAPLGTLDDATPDPTQTPVSITPEAAWGGAGQCPQDVVLNVMGQSVPFKFSGACQFFQLMNPVVLAAAWVSALFIFIGGVRTES